MATQCGFELRVTVQPARRLLHPLAQPLGTGTVAGPLHACPRLLHFLPAFHEPLGTRVRV